MTAEWYYRNSMGLMDGPVTAARLKQLAQLGEIGPETEIKKGVEGRWVTANKVKGLIAPEPPKPVKTAPPAWQQPSDEGDEPEPTPYTPTPYKPLLPLAHNQPSESETANKRSPLLLVGVGGTLLAVVVIAVIAMQTGESKKPDQDRTPTPSIAGPSAEDRQREAKLAEERRKAEEIKKQGQAFEDAKRLLTENLRSAGGSAEANVKKGVELLNQHLSRPAASNQAEAKRLLEHAEIVLSDEKAMAFLLSLSDFQRRQAAGEPDASVGDLVIVNKPMLERLSPAFSDVFERKLEKPGEETSVFIEGGEYRSSMANVFFDRLKKNARASIQQVAKQEADVKLERERQRQEKEKQAVLQNGTDEFKRIVEYPEKYIFGHYYFDGVFGSRFGNMKRDKKADCYTIAFQCQKKQIFPASFGLQKDQINFVVSDDIGNKLLDLKDGEFFARIYCRIKYGNPEYNTFPMAVIYKIEFYEDAIYTGKPKVTVE